MMLATYNHSRLLRTVLIGFTAVITTLATSSWAGINRDGNYDDGYLIWSKISDQLYDFQQAAEVCQGKTRANPHSGNWMLPTPEQMKKFYLNVAIDKKNLPGWSLGMTWLSTKSNDIKNDAANLDSGDLNWKGFEDNSRFFVVCVTSNLTHFVFDGLHKWSRTTTERKTIGEANAYCAAMNNGTDPEHTWQMPNMNQLKSFEADVVGTRKNELLEAGWTLDFTLSRDEYYNGMYSGIVLSTGELASSERGYVTCIQERSD